MPAESTPRSVRHLVRVARWISADGIACRVRALRRLCIEKGGWGFPATVNVRFATRATVGTCGAAPGGCSGRDTRSLGERRIADGESRPTRDGRRHPARTGCSPSSLDDLGTRNAALRMTRGAALGVARAVRADKGRGLSPPPFETLDKGEAGGRRRGLGRPRSGDGDAPRTLRAGRG